MRFNKLKLCFCCLVWILAIGILTGLSPSPRAMANPYPAPDAPPIADSVILSNSATAPAYAVVVEKKTQHLFLYQITEPIKKIAEFICSTGENSGAKQKSGDKKTPEGVYFCTKKVDDKYLSDVYGSWALPIDYPNSLDRQAGRNGHAIWLHGTNKPIKAQASNGCVALANKDIDQLERYITLNRTPIIILDTLEDTPPADPDSVKSGINTLITGLNRALSQYNYHQYLEYYAASYAPDISWWNTFRKLRDHLNQAKLPLVIEADNLSIFKHKDVYVVLYDQRLKTANDTKRIGTNKLFLKKFGNKFLIIGEEYQAPAEHNTKGTFEHPLITACREANNFQYADNDIGSLIEGWLDAWTSKDIKRYRSYYAKDFWSNGKNLKSWIKHKKRLNRKYRRIQISTKNLKITKGKQRSTAVFFQTYKSDRYKAVGIKRLTFKREKGQWKIYRETWRKT